MAATGIPAFAIDEDEATRPQKKPRNATVEVFDVDSDLPNQEAPPARTSKRKRGGGTRKKHGITNTSAKKPVIHPEHVFGHSEAKTGLKKGRADQILTELIGDWHPVGGGGFRFILLPPKLTT